MKLVKRNLLLGNQKQAALLAGDLEILHLFLTQVTGFTHSNSCREEDPGNEAMKGGGREGHSMKYTVVRVRVFTAKNPPKWSNTGMQSL